MRPPTRIAIAVIVVCVALLILWIARPAPPTAADLINAQIQTAVNGAENHSIGSIMSVVSSSYQDDNGMTDDGLRLMLGHAFDGSGRVSVTVSPPVIKVNGDTATSDCNLTVTDSDVGRQPIFDHTLRLNWTKEPGHHLLIIPTTVWRVTKADYGSLIF